MTGGPIWLPKQQLDGICVSGLHTKKNKSHISASCFTGTLSMQLHDWGCFQCFSMSLIARGGRWKNTVLCIHCSFHDLHICSTSNQPWKGIHIFQLPRFFVDPIISSHLNRFNRLNYAYTHPYVPSYAAYGFSSTTNTLIHRHKYHKQASFCVIYTVV